MTANAPIDHGCQDCGEQHFNGGEALECDERISLRDCFFPCNCKRCLRVKWFRSLYGPKSDKEEECNICPICGGIGFTTNNPQNLDSTLCIGCHGKRKITKAVLASWKDNKIDTYESMWEYREYMAKSLGWKK